MCENGRENGKTATPFEEALTKSGNGIYNIGLVCTCSLILLGVGCDLFGFTLVVQAACDLDITLAQKGILTSLPYVGILLASYFWGYISDTRGRRLTLMLSMPAGFLLSCASCLSTNWLLLAMIKFFATAFACAANSAAYTLVGESCALRVRNKYMLLMTCFLLFSPAAAAILAFPVLKLDFASPIPWLGIVFRPWRLLCIILALPSGLGALAIYFFYESPKFLANTGQNEAALEVLKKMYAINNREDPEEFKVSSLQLPEYFNAGKERSLLHNLYEQSAPLFRPPLVKRTAQLFYIVFVVYITNNSFLTWLPLIMDELRTALEHHQGNPGNLCALITSHRPVVNVTVEATGFDNTTTAIPTLCEGAVKDDSLLTLMASQTIFAILNFLLSQLPNHRKAVLITILSSSALSGILLNLMPEPISSVIFFMVLTCTCLGMGILASYFVDLFPTSYRGMVACLSIMVGRSSTFVGINVVGNLLFTRCSLTFYMWSLLVASGVVAAWFLPPDKPPEREETRL
ncbi:unnamed protein product [Plutella xylostella]|uniref:(diamondback moth) hypothetical protein n=1 Tax=Plutella xylostella TaxID=51655 RepID=A0A8S4EXW4_PLUXY|nr:unnamed protein product [Plutella xylostella]